MMTKSFALLTVLVLAACQMEAGDQESAEAPASGDLRGDAPDTVETPPADAPEFTDYAADYTGEWAAAGDCGTPMTWEFAVDHVYTAGEMACDIAEIRNGPGQINLLTENCMAEGAAQPDYGFTLTPLGEDRMEVDFRAKTVLERCG